ncbi:Isopentenyldiphosphate isomerase [Pricia antarctica]|uniref:Isopentenyldiphosphate isomerase n=1 Tax=Pricia antarctica TaxID=641691 RepID=A0A1G7ETL6_9FLAO|nr:NUDIX domain-containing protein [Pricia antarctica]SDE67053.1 Isopentenyldiphosphate isomerase [Pricia antarctica]
MDELVDILDSEGKFTGRTGLKSEAHENGWFHATVHIWFFTSDGSVLIQQRAKNKDAHPLLWDVSVAGHVGAGEQIEDAAVREVKEEIGLEIINADLQEIGIFKAIHKHTENLLDCEFHHVFLGKLNLPLSALIKQVSEVAELKLIPLIRFSEETWGLANLGKYVPHGAEYYKTIIKAVKERL